LIPWFVLPVALDGSQSLPVSNAGSSSSRNTTIGGRK
jgi:hypothetical protein